MGMLCNLSKQTNSSGNGQNALACSCGGWVGGGGGEGRGDKDGLSSTFCLAHSCYVISADQICTK